MWEEQKSCGHADLRLKRCRGCVRSYVKAQTIEPSNPKLKLRVKNARKQLAINLEMKHEIDLYDAATVQQDEAAAKIQVRKVRNPQSEHLSVMDGYSICQSSIKDVKSVRFSVADENSSDDGSIESVPSILPSMTDWPP